MENEISDYEKNIVDYFDLHDEYNTWCKVKGDYDDEECFADVTINLGGIHVEDLFVFHLENDAEYEAVANLKRFCNCNKVWCRKT